MENIQITLPSGDKKAFKKGVTCDEVAGFISPSLRKAVVLAEVDGNLCSLSDILEKDCSLSLLKRSDKKVLEVIRHDCAHVLAEAVQKLFPNTLVAFGPAIENGFYYDFFSDYRFTPEDFAAIEKEMHNIVDQKKPFIKEEWTRDEAKAFFTKMGEKFKAEHVSAIPKEEKLTIYKQGDWLDLCRGPHTRTTADIGHGFKLSKVAGAYWKGDAKGAQLQRIYGTCWHSKEDLANYLTVLEEAEKRDHRRIAVNMDLFHLSSDAIGSVFWHDAGWTIYREIENYMRRRLRREGYQEVNTPQLLDRSLWEKSGHWEKYAENMFIVPDKHEEGRLMALKPMNCPCHVMIFKQGTPSYRDLPLRMAEFGSCMRDEPSGSLHGIMRVRNFTQDDAHIFCSEDQIIDETIRFCNLLDSVYRDFGFDNFKAYFADRPEVRAGSDATWDRAEKALKGAIEASGLPMEINKGDGAFYGPKLDFVLRDAIGRDWQCGTLQVDFVLPERLDAWYADRDGERKRPVMLHRAVLGSLERFLGVLIENYAGSLPLWLAPLQVGILPVGESFEGYAKKALDALQQQNIRSFLDSRNQTLQYRIRDNSVRKVSEQWIIGKREEQEETVTIRRLGSNDQETIPLKQAIEAIKISALPPDLRG